MRRKTIILLLMLLLVLLVIQFTSSVTAKSNEKYNLLEPKVPYLPPGWNHPSGDESNPDIGLPLLPPPPPTHDLIA